MNTDEKNNEMTLIISVKRKPDGGFGVKIEGQGNNERKAREELFSVLSVKQIGREKVLKQLGNHIFNEVLTNITRIFGLRKDVPNNIGD
ncbi:hypothetical protein A3I18_01255 [Candidatus Campbellbacteria bacterium RIFCSPLOWO2_02_FULL_35_11]|uniref:Uncharacterized protein n=2 Tax=Candidatus Campbelliibacteriota TaxID=1752727 RepID=A0A1F5EKF8_9BACT|nr:MAG: hypothetical protein A3E89_00660 [Candidatus Campbellbacteria bacterium RIFCSPHIGHO2_12_FULL_35_10]OGD70598.1 MAG: hypothetical protein A3I18_01255 [Candidatus Campbellbacteria bacterium RIFCSPLOWO2_02_FULL_35_11]